MKRDFVEIEDVIDYHFKDREILFTALTHPSYANEHNMRSYDRLEFVGDSILDFVIADELFRMYRDEDEGFLTKMRASIVSRDPLSYVVKKYGFVDYMLISGAEHRQMGNKELSNVFEALVGAIYYDGGIDASRDFILKFLSTNLENTKIEDIDSKSMLQEFVQDKNLGHIEYSCIEHDFNDNIHTYTMQVEVDGHVAIGAGKNRQAGEKIAAKKMLEILRKKYIKR